MTLPVRLPRAVLYDWDNTLADNWGSIHAALNVTLVAMGQAPWTRAETQARLRKSLRDSFPERFGERWQEARDIFYDHFRTHHLDGLRPLPGAEALLRDCAERGIYQAVVSNKTGSFLRAEAAALGWTGYFGQLVGAADAAADKPDPAPVALALAPAGISLGSPAMGETWFVGDAEIDMECAHGTACVPVLVGDGDFAPESRYPPTLRFESCLALCSLVRQLGDTICVAAVAARATEFG
ncbi:MAG: HAD hydrolase-like protein [Azospirillum sp.]|nr:HAD hydrolase-like protein [Azospirillum sp.]